MLVLKPIPFVFLLGFLLGGVAANLIRGLEHRSFTEPLYSRNSCLSNGLFYQKVTGVRKDDYFGDKLYEMRNYDKGRVIGVDTVAVWVADRNFTEADISNCMTTEDK